MKIHRLIHCICFKLKHYISRIGPWDYGTVKNSKSRRHKIFGMVEIWVEQNYYSFAAGAIKYSNWQEIPPFYWDEFEAKQ